MTKASFINHTNVALARIFTKLMPFTEVPAPHTLILKEYIRLTFIMCTCIEHPLSHLFSKIGDYTKIRCFNDINTTLGVQFSLCPLLSHLHKSYRGFTE